MAENEYLRCQKCGRPLKDYISRKRGYGSVCWHTHLIEEKLSSGVLFRLNGDENKNVK